MWMEQLGFGCQSLWCLVEVVPYWSWELGESREVRNRGLVHINVQEGDDERCRFTPKGQGSEVTRFAVIEASYWIELGRGEGVVFGGSPWGKGD